ncbi:MAG TPA: HD domain-containing protein [Roseiflexaceae bacterium]|nr:HD domain-containing protein [Roseiflexaceae bacterium]
MQSIDWAYWETLFEGFLDRSMGADIAHDREHIRRVVRSAHALAAAEQADLAVAIPAAWLHDCVIVPKDSPLRSQASRLAADAAITFLRECGYTHADLDAIGHAIAAHSFSANIAPRSLEARVVQDADRLDSLGAIGVARCLMLSASLGRRLYDPTAPFPDSRPPDDLANAIDHFYVKLLRLADTMQTAAGRAEAQRRTAFMQAFLDQLRSEITAVEV